MSTARVDIIDRSFEKAHTWINDTADELGTGDSHEACLSAACSMRAGTPACDGDRPPARSPGRLRLVHRVS
jgi:hypothetical protein